MLGLPEPPAAVASTPPHHTATPPSAPVEDASGRGNRFTGIAPVFGITPVDGWVLMSDNPLRPRFSPAEYFARGPAEDRHIDVSRWELSFTPTQARFEWLVRNGFPARINKGPWHNDEIDAAIAADARRAA